MFKELVLHPVGSRGLQMSAKPLILKPYAESDSGNTSLPPACVGTEIHWQGSARCAGAAQRRSADCLGCRSWTPCAPRRASFAQPEQGLGKRPLVFAGATPELLFRGSDRHGQLPKAPGATALAGAWAWAV